MIRSRILFFGKYAFCFHLPYKKAWGWDGEWTGEIGWFVFEGVLR